MEELELLLPLLEDRQVTQARLNMTVAFPTNFMLIGTMNPCPCRHQNART